MYAIDGGDANIYYGQVAINQQLGFFKYRSAVVNESGAYESELMCRFSVQLSSIGEAVRNGCWLNLGRKELRDELADHPVLVQCPVGTTRVTLWQQGHVVRETEVHDPAIQKLEVIAAHDATYHVPARLKAEYDQSTELLMLGGSVYHYRRRMEHFAASSPDKPCHMLPANWVPVGPLA